MKRVYSSQNITMVLHLKDVLENQGIVCLIKNENLLGAAGGLPPIDCWPELWVAEDSQYDQAKAIIETALSSQVSPGLPWKCPGCGEEQEPQFTDCWNCGGSRTEEAARYPAD